VQICLCDVNVAIDLPGLPQIPAPATDQSCAATSSANTLIGVGCPHAAPSCANLHSARRSRRHRLPFPAGSFIEGFRTPATVQAASLRSAGIRNPQQKAKYSLRANVFRSVPNNGHRATTAACPFRAKSRSPCSSLWLVRYARVSKSLSYSVAHLR
jgi:hypothetical protein